MFATLEPPDAVAQTTTAPPIKSSVAILGNDVLLVHTRRSPSCKPAGALVLFAGLNRNAYDYLDRARALATARCLSLYAPEFDRRKFPRWRYQRGGVYRAGRLLEPSSCTGHVIGRLISWIRQQERQSDLPIILFGHSAGGQMLSRVTAYCPLTGNEQPSRIVIANPSGYVSADVDETVPYGFSMPGKPSQMLPNADERLKAYLAQPVTIYVGNRDTGSKMLNQEAGARRQGANRHERGLNVFEEARRAAQNRGWPFGWRLVVAKGVGHSSTGMLSAPEAENAIAASSL